MARVENLIGAIGEWVRTHSEPSTGPTLVIKFKITPEEEVFNPFANEASRDRFRREAFMRVPGVVNFFRSDVEAALRSQDE